MHMDPHRQSDGRQRRSSSDKSTLEELLKYASQSAGKTLGVDEYKTTNWQKIRTNSISNIGQANKEETTPSKDIPGDFDIYLFAQVWAPRFCCTKQKQCREEQNKNDLTVHGLWPAYQANSTYPTYCTNNTNNTNIQSKNKLAIHEWKKHGTYSHSLLNSNLSHSQYRNLYNTDIRPIC